MTILRVTKSKLNYRYEHDLLVDNYLIFLYGEFDAIIVWLQVYQKQSGWSSSIIYVRILTLTFLWYKNFTTMNLCSYQMEMYIQSHYNSYIIYPFFSCEKLFLITDFDWDWSSRNKVLDNRWKCQKNCRKTINLKKLY